MKKNERIYGDLTGEIKSGELRAGGRLPNEMALAARYGVSRQTVRLALKKLADDALIEKIQGSGSYVSGSAAQARSMRIAVITTHISTYIFPFILRGIEKTVTRNRCTMTLSATNNSLAKERGILEILSGSSVDGIIAEGTKTALPNPNLAYYRKMLSGGIPLVFFNGYYPELLRAPWAEKTAYVVTDDREGGRALTQELIRAGHRRIAGIFKSDDLQGHSRYAGYMDALTKNEIPIRDDAVFWFATENRGGFVRGLVSSGALSGCTAAVCYNDEVAQQLLECALDGLLPGLTAVRSFDGIISSAPGGIDFRSLIHPKEAVGSLAAEKLFGMLSGKAETSCAVRWLGR